MTGDRVLRAEGILSGSMSYILGLLGEGVSLSEAVGRAKESGFTEPDPRDDPVAWTWRAAAHPGPGAGPGAGAGTTMVGALLPPTSDASGDIPLVHGPAAPAGRPFRHRDRRPQDPGEDPALRGLPVGQWLSRGACCPWMQTIPSSPSRAARTPWPCSRSATSPPHGHPRLRRGCRGHGRPACWRTSLRLVPPAPARRGRL